MTAAHHPDPSEVNEADQLAYLAANRVRMPELETCRCDAASYLHLTGLIPGTGDPGVRTCMVVQEDRTAITVLLITGGGSKPPHARVPG